MKRITKDIEHLQRKDLETRNEISTQNRKFFHSRSVQEKKVQESQEKVHQFMADMKQRLEDREAGGCVVIRLLVPAVHVNMVISNFCSTS